MSATADGPRSLDEVALLYQPASHYAIRPNRYPVGSSFLEAGKPSVLHVLSGTCSIGIGAKVFQLQAGSILQLPGGERTFKVVGHEPAEVVKIFLLAEMQIIEGEE